MYKVTESEKEIKNYSFKEGLPQEFEILDLEKLYEGFREDLTAPHRTGFYHIIWFQKGAPSHLVDFQKVSIEENSVLFLNKDIVQCFDKSEGFKGKVILFTDNFFCQTQEDTSYIKSNILFNDLLAVSKIQLSKKSDLFSDLLSQMELELSNSKDNYQANILKNLLHNLLLHAERERRKQGFIEIKKDANLQYVLTFKELLDKSFVKQKQVSFYHSEMCITAKRLNAATKKVFGKTPKELIDERVLLEANRLLAHTADNVKTVGFELGFEEPTNFVKYFKKHSGKTPLEFRANFK